MRTRTSRGLAVSGITVLSLAAAVLVLGYLAKPAIVPEPGTDRALNPARPAEAVAYDFWGREISSSQAHDAPAAQLSPAAGAVAITPELTQLGRDAFYAETFGNELVLTDVVGILDGPAPLTSFVRAIAMLRGSATDNLVIELERAAVIGGRRFAKGEKVATGLDVMPAGVAPLGMKVVIEDGRPRAGITCALCHATVDAARGKLVEGAPNLDLQVGLILAFAANSAAMLANAEVGPLGQYTSEQGVELRTSAGPPERLPDPRALEDAVDRVLVSWPPGHFDATPDGVANPGQIPSCFTRGGHPYGHTGFAAAGPFRGLSVVNNNVHGLNADPFVSADAASVTLGVDKELYLGTLLQRAARPEMRFDPRAGLLPSRLLRKLVPNPDLPVFVQAIELPTYPKASFVAPDGLWVSSPGHRVWEQVNAMSAFENVLTPPPYAVDRALAMRGRELFAQAGCKGCHSGKYLTNNQVLPVEQIRTEPARALALKKLEAFMVPSVGRPFSEPVPFQHEVQLPVPIDAALEQQLKLSWAFGESAGGYKVPALVGLAWTAPYLHDGGVAVGAAGMSSVGVPGTWDKGVRPDPKNSLRALVDRPLRAQVVTANRGSAAASSVHVTGQGHEFWVDAMAGYTSADQDALIAYLLSEPK